MNVYLVTVAICDNEVGGCPTFDKPEPGLFHHLHEASYVIVLERNTEVVVRPSLLSKQRIYPPPTVKPNVNTRLLQQVKDAQDVIGGHHDGQIIA